MTPRETTVIRPRQGWFDSDFRKVWRYRDLLFIFAARDVKVRYRQTLLGPAWLVIQPLALALVFTVAVSGAAGVSTEGRPAPLFYLAALVAWTYFSQALQSISTVFVSNADLFGKIYFPRIVVPLSTLLGSAVAIVIQFALALAFVVAYAATGAFPGVPWSVVLFPLVALHLAAVSLGFGLFLAATTAKYRDTTHAMPFLIQLWMFVTPVIYPYSAIPEGWRALVVALNPLAAAVEEARWSLLGTSALGAGEVAISLVATAIYFAVGLILFQRVERTAMDTV